LLNKQLRATSLTVRDIPQQPYRDWAGLILGIEPEYAFDLPSIEWFCNWFVASLIAVFLPSILLAGVIFLVLRRWMSWRHWRILSGVIAFVLGAVGTTLFSHAVNDFVFTWQTCLFVAFLPIVSLVRWQNNTTEPTSRWRSYLLVAVFVLVCLAYFLVCRRLSLVFEWAFLFGFPAAVPFALLARRFAARAGAWQRLPELLLQGVAFTAFYWSSVAILWWRY
jgi:hypothetical protein